MVPIQMNSETQLRPGRYLEILTAQLEHILGAGTLTVKSPERFRNRHTGHSVEVDVTLRGKIGSTDILVALECRDRSGPQGVDWIWELATKKDVIGASVIVAVSRDGFTRDAIDEANVKGVILKTLSRLSEDEIADTVLGLQVEVLRPRYLLNGFAQISYVPFMLDPYEPPVFDMEDLWKLVRSPSEQGLYDKMEDKWISFSELLAMAEWEPVIRNLNLSQKKKVEVTVPCTFVSSWRDSEPRYHLYKDPVPKSFVGFSRMTILAEVWYEPEPAELSAAFKYSEADHCIARVAKFNLAPKGRPADVLQVVLIDREPNVDAR